jgi:polynucleotide kinase-phosphatase
VVAHAGLKEAYHGRASGRVRAFALYGDVTGESDEHGLPIRHPWAAEYRGRAMVLYGHTPVAEARWVNNTLCLDTGCVFGGALTALRYPEKELVQVPAGRVHAEPLRPLAAPGGEGADRDPDVLDAADVLGKRVVETKWMGRVTVQADQAAGAFEVMSRFAVEPARLAYLPPTMAPVASSQLEDYLEHPLEAFSQYAAAGVDEVICEEKHMGSRAVVWVAAPGATAPEALHTRTGRPFFAPDLEREALERVRRAAEAAGLWQELGADWLLFDAELMPWSLKAEALLDQQYRPVGAAAAAMYAAALPELRAGIERGLEGLAGLVERCAHRGANAEAFARVVERYAWPVDGLAGVKLAPFQLLASNAQALYALPHPWHLEVADRLAAADPDLFQTTRSLRAETGRAASCDQAVAWWEELTAAGGEGMVVKPLAGPLRAAKGLVQPGLKVRGREYLRITYGPDYLDRLEQLKDRNLGRKRSLALREYALGLEAIDRLVAGEPLWRRHQAVFAVLALESDPVDPRL